MASLLSQWRTCRQLWALLAWVSILAAPIVRADGVSISAQSEVPDWASSNSLRMILSNLGGPKPPSGQMFIFPVTENSGLDASDQIKDMIKIHGNLISTNSSNYNEPSNQDDVAYLSCDAPSNAGFLDPSTILNKLIGFAPKAIVLYSTVGNWCSLSNGGSPLDYKYILSMTDAGDSQAVASYLNSTSTGTVANLVTNGDSSLDGNTPGSGGGGSGVAMSILYTITGLIALLFLGIIGTGAWRAHRYPERYGPRRAFAGRPRQSRAKGLARAMLETLPIVKFGDETPAKQDPELELEDAAQDPERATQRTASMLSDEIRSTEATAGTQGSGEIAPEKSATKGTASSNDPSHTEDGHLGCSICTEDFTVGEDVRLLPCNHQFHPTCIDPWLINVSGTCPLCRLDLRVGNERLSTNEDLPPPLALEGDDASSQGRNRISRFFDINRLRQASPEEQVAALRRMREEEEQGEEQLPPQQDDGDQNESSAAGPSNEPRQGASFTAKLKDKFRIKTRAQAPGS